MPTKAALFRNIRRAISRIVVCGGPQMKSPPFIITGSGFFRQEIPPLDAGRGPYFQARKQRVPPYLCFHEVAVGKLLYLSRPRGLVYYDFKINEKNRPVERYEHLKTKRARNMLTTSDHLSDLRDRAILYAKTLKSQRQQLASPEFWYPYGSINNFDVLNALLTGENRNIFRDTTPKRAADIG